MGLDMYLHASKYVSKHDYDSKMEDDEFELTDEYKQLLPFFPEKADEFGDYAGANIQLTIGYWRKSNQIHAWFVKNCGGGVDECQEMYVGADMLRELRAIVEHVLETRSSVDAEKHLPPQSGFFFGSTEVDEWYWQDLEKTVKILNKAIDLDENHSMSIHYRASW